MLTLDRLRRYAVARTLFTPTSLARAIAKLGFVQADPIRSPARAQDLTLRHRVTNYRAGDLERRYPRLAVEEGFFINYGFLARGDYLRMHPRRVPRGWSPTQKRRAEAILDFVRERRQVSLRDIDERFAHGNTTNYWGGSSKATTHLVGEMHYYGMVRVARRDGGLKIYAAHEMVPEPLDTASRRAHADALVDIIVRKYAPLPAQSLGPLVWRLRYATPQWRADLRPALARAKARLAHARVEGVDWYWPATERPDSRRFAVPDEVRLLSPFDPLVWDRRRFAILWGWDYRFEAYTPAAKRKFGYYALPLLWRDCVIGWANVTARGSRFDHALGFVDRRPADAGFEPQLEAELLRLRAFLSDATKDAD